jgi:hypothetical protein
MIASRTRSLARAVPLALVLLLGSSALAADSVIDVTGTWKMEVKTAQGTGQPTLDLKQDGEKVTGTYKGQLGEAPLTGNVKGEALTLNFKISGPMGELPVEYSGRVAGDAMEGKVKLGPGEGTFTGKRQ